MTWIQVCRNTDFDKSSQGSVKMKNYSQRNSRMRYTLSNTVRKKDLDSSHDPFTATLVDSWSLSTCLS